LSADTRLSTALVRYRLSATASCSESRLRKP
jgi:hypothetical protein